jgi:hypothetical protein
MNTRRGRQLEKAEKIYKEIAEDDKQLAEDFLSICAESAEKYKTVRNAGRRGVK